MALKSDEPIHVLLVGTPANAQTIFLEALVHKLEKQAYIATGSSRTKAGFINMLFMKVPKYLMVDEITASDQANELFVL